ncbi:WhiB family transcriptional regulator [Rhodococcus sp. D-6]|uniref:Transcriptional regulator WhiB n=1 Tax=Rhodococcus sp. D-6 TaxID=1387842 RepID=A0AAU7V649_9NOCA|nr:WhiB family transcriptional regulator [Rhodococcus sp. HS-D2]
MPSLTSSTPRLQPCLEAWDWQLRARCRGFSTAAFFPPDRETRGARLRREQEAKRVCQQCPVVRECRSHALRVGERYGVWGGTSETDRRDLAAGSAATPVRALHTGAQGSVATHPHPAAADSTRQELIPA